MWLQLKRIVAERETLMAVVIFGVVVMLADLFTDLNWHIMAATLRLFGFVMLIMLFVFELMLKHVPLAVPLLFTTERERNIARIMFDTFVKTQKLSVNVVEKITRLRGSDLIIRLNYDPRGQPDPNNPSHWQRAWQELLREWEEADRTLIRDLAPSETVCYHIHPHLWLPLAFALGASVGLRRSIVLYHRQPEGFFRVLDLTHPRVLFHAPLPSVPPPTKAPEDLTALPPAEKLILHVRISDRHIGQFAEHPDYNRPNTTSAALVYRQALNPREGWLGYIQHLWQEIQPLLGKYRQVEVCLICPSAIAFALGMAFSREANVSVCDYQEGKYVPVFSLKEIERRLPFD